MTKVSYPLRIPENIMELAELRTKEEHVDKATALRQLIHMGAEDYVLKLYSEGRISLSKAAKLLDKSVHDVIQISRKKGIRAGATDQQQKQSQKTAEQILG